MQGRVLDLRCLYSTLTIFVYVPFQTSLGRTSSYCTLIVSNFDRILKPQQIQEIREKSQTPSLCM
jgi:hypothetical protein